MTESNDTDVTEKDRKDAEEPADQQAQKPAVADQKPAVAGQAQKPAVADQKPAVAGQAQKPAVAEQAQKPAVAEQAQKPAVAEQAQKPAVAEQAQKPAVAEQDQKPAVAEQAQTPAVAEQAQTPAVAEQAQTPAVAEQAQTTGIFRKIDDAVYRVETVVVVSALIAMSVFVFTDVTYQLAISMSQNLGSGGSAIWQLAAILGFIGLMGFAATGREEAEEQMPTPKRIGIAVAVVAGSFVVGYSLLKLESSTVYRVVLVALSVPAFLVFKDDKKRAITFAVGAAIAFYVFGKLPSGFSWAQSYSLVLLLWVGFLGASIAARQRRHLRVDLMRKLCPEKFLAHFNAVSYFVAGSFTAVVLYLGYLYMFGVDSSYMKPIWDAPAWLPEAFRTQLESEFPLPDDASLFRRVSQVFFASSEPGELPDWLKAAAVPVSMLLIATRFFAHSITFGLMAARNEPFQENMTETH